MASSDAKTVKDYLESLPSARREVIEHVRRVILKRLPNGMDEVMNWGMITYEIPLARYSDTYNKKPLMVAALAAQKKHYAVYLSGMYADEKLLNQLLDAYRHMGVKPNIGKSCVRFTQLSKLPIETIGDIIAALPVDAFIALYEQPRNK